MVVVVVVTVVVLAVVEEDLVEDLVVVLLKVVISVEDGSFSASLVVGSFISNSVSPSRIAVTGSVVEASSSSLSGISKIESSGATPDPSS